MNASKDLPSVIYRYYVEMMQPGDLLLHGGDYLLVWFEGRQALFYNLRTKEAYKHYGSGAVGNLFREGEEIRGMFWSLRSWE